MKAYEVQAGSRSLADIKLVARPDPEPGFGEIVVRIRAASLNFRDQMVVEGMYGPAASAFKTIPLSDGAGEVIATGEGVTRFEVGDRVTSTFFKDWLDGPPRADARVSIGAAGVDGVLSEYAVFHAQNA